MNTLRRIHKVATIPLIGLAALIDIPMVVSYSRLSVETLDAQWQLGFLPLLPAVGLASLALILSLAVWPIRPWLVTITLVFLLIPLLIIFAIRHWYFLH